MSNLRENIEGNRRVWNDVTRWTADGDEWSTHFGTTDRLYSEFIYPRIGSYLKGRVLEIAPGRGRMTRKLLESKGIELEILDLNETCIARCKERFGPTIRGYHVGNGRDLRAIGTNSKDFIFSFDSFVHMHDEVIDNYLSEIERVLDEGGYCWIHHSNLFGGQEDNFSNVAGRSNMSNDRFAELSRKYGLTVVNQELIRWDAEGNPDWLHDGFTLIRKGQ